ncbi:penicillin-binding transpeptidase domain-containing protein [Kitasatospora sp. NPDC057223]|uniref:penicillin-binding transpeptidase domain-containing protein n=1 Tax=Kitasatospora sp. NPDC057223 TaxID=3346055 RepID=UPI00363A2A2B
MRRGAKIGFITGVSVAMIGGAGYGAYSLVGPGASDDPKAPKVRTVVADPPSPELAASGSKAFLDAWTSGDLEAAGKLTDDPQAATAALQAFKDKVKPSGMTLTAGGPATPAAFASATAAPSSAAAPKATASATAPAGASASASATGTPAPAGQVLMGFKAKAEFEGTTSVWNYDGFLGVVKMSDGTSAVHWAPTVIHPHLAEGETITAQPIFAPPSAMTDRNGKSVASFASLASVLAGIPKNSIANDPADAGNGVVIVDASGKGTPENLFTVTAPKPGKPLKLTIDVALQAAAEKAVLDQSQGGKRKASLVAIEPSTGKILAVANAPATGFNTAFLGATAPGSTMKVITAAALLESGLSPDSPMPCPPTTTAGHTIKNDFEEPHPEYTFKDDFTNSCNTAFVIEGKSKLKSGDLADLGAKAFGFGTTWKVGVPNFDAVIPPAGQNPDETADEYYGQGKTKMNPLAMASVAATVKGGVFKQPILIDGLTQIQAPGQLSPDTLTKLREMMAATAHSGTAAGPMAGLKGDIGGKTGTAERAAGQATDSWFTSYRDNLAVAAMVEGGGHGVDAAGPASAAVLAVGNG